MIDSRQTDVAEAQRLLAAAQRDGAVPLPELLAVDLCALGAALQSMFDQEVWQSWVRLPGVVRQEWAVASRTGLARRRLLDPPAPVGIDGDILASRVAPPLALIMVARSRPAFIAVGSVAGNQRGAPRMYGIAEVDQGLRAVLVEYASMERIGLGTGERRTMPASVDQERAGDLHQLYKYLLISPGRAVGVFSQWLTAAPGGGGHADQGARIVDVLRNREGAGLTRDRLTATANPSGSIRITCDLTGDHPQSPPGYEVAHVPGLLTEMLLVRTRQ